MSPVRLLWVTSVFHPEPGGGSGVHVYNCVKALRAKEHQITVVAAKTTDEIPADETWADGTRVIRYPGRFENPRAGIKAANRCYGLLKNLDPRQYDAIICGSLYSDIAAFKWAGKNKLPCLYFFYGPMDLEYGTEILGLMDKRGPILKRLSKILLSPLLEIMKRGQAGFIKSASVTATLSRHSREIIDGHFQVKPCHSAIISGGADHNFFQPALDRESLKKELGYHSARPLILAVRRLIPRTGIDLLIEAMPALAAKHPQVLLLVVGQGALKEKLEKRAINLGLESQVKFLGYVSEVQKARLYQAADISVVPTASLEGFGLSIAESLACGTPVLGTPVGSIPEILERLDRRLIFESASAESIASGIINIFENGKPGSDLREKAVQLAREHYSWAVAADGIERVLSEILPGR
jgi:glycosyltransferase involved in cell wall biosynthesis